MSFRVLNGVSSRLTFTGFRHGGASELDGAGVEDLRPLTAHDQTSTTRIYNEANERKARIIASKHGEHIAMLEELEVAG